MNKRKEVSKMRGHPADPPIKSETESGIVVVSFRHCLKEKPKWDY
jgi:hypothetical protein